MPAMSLRCLNVTKIREMLRADRFEEISSIVFYYTLTAMIAKNKILQKSLSRIFRLN